MLGPMRIWTNEKSAEGSLCKFDSISELIHDQINSLLKIFKTIGAGEPQLGPGSLDWSMCGRPRTTEGIKSVNP